MTAMWTRSFVRTRAILVWALLCASSCAAGHKPTHVPASELTALALYPLRTDAAWSYDVDSGDGAPVLATVRVLRADQRFAEVQAGQKIVRYALVDGGIARANAGLGASGQYLLRAPFVTDASWASGERAHARVASTGQRVTTPAGQFEDCVEILEEHADSLQEVTTTYCPNVGPVRVDSRMQVRGQAVRVLATLRGFSVN